MVANMYPMSPEMVSRLVQKVLCDSLGVEEDETRLSATLYGDLGAESIDELDICFRLESAFSIRLPRGMLMPLPDTSCRTFVHHGQFTAAGIDELKRLSPAVDLRFFRLNPDLSKVRDLLTVRYLVDLVTAKRDEQ